jgi:hypothetical protein
VHAGVSYYWVLEARDELIRSTAHKATSHGSQCPTPNAPSIPTHASLQSPFFETSAPPLTTPGPPQPRPGSSPPTHGAASPRLQSAIFPNPTSYSRPASRTTASRGAASVRRVTGRGRRFPSTGTSASRASPGHTRSPADSKVDAARELRHSTVNALCSDGILAAAAPDGREAADAAVRLKARAGSGASTTFRSSPPSPIADAAVQQDLVDMKVIFFLSLRSR